MLLDLEHSFEEIKGINIAKHIILPINSSINKDIKLKFPVWIKINSSEHKLKINGVKKCDNLDELKKVHAEFKKKFPQKTFLVQENVEGSQIMLGIKEDKTFGKIILIGEGGSSVEEKKNIQFRVLPMGEAEIKSTLQEANLKINDDLISLIEKLSKLKIKEADFNPIIVNDKAWIVDARIEIEED
jgi:hypothetical protein